MLHLNINYSDKSNPAIKLQLYEHIKSLAKLMMSGQIVVVDLPGPRFIERYEQFQDPRIIYVAAEKKARIRGQVRKELQDRNLIGFVSTDWFKLAEDILASNGQAVLSYDGTESVVSFIKRGRVEQFNKLLHSVEANSFIINICLSRRLSYYDLQGLDPVNPELTPTEDCIQQILYNMKLVLQYHDYVIEPVRIGGHPVLNVFNYGGRQNGMNMTNIILPCQHKRLN